MQAVFNDRQNGARQEGYAIILDGFGLPSQAGWVPFNRFADKATIFEHVDMYGLARQRIDGSPSVVTLPKSTELSCPQRDNAMGPGTSFGDLYRVKNAN
jgi:hypothetical protein